MDERIAVSKISRRRFFKRTAKSILFSDWINQILAFLIVGALYNGIFEFGVSGMILIDEVTGNWFVSTSLLLLYSLLAAAVIIPLFYGLVVYEINAVEKRKGNITDIFTPFSSATLMIRSYKLFVYLLFKTILCMLPAVLTALLLFGEQFEFFSLEAFVWNNINFAYLLIVTLLFICIFAGMVLSVKQFVGAFICVLKPSMRIRDCFFTSKVCCYGSRAEVARLMISFLPLMWLSLYTAGLLFVMYSLPYMLITLVLQSKYLYDKEINTKNIQNLLYNNQEN